MELLNIGRHCSNTDCNQLDYLPFKCQHCRNYYCGEHSKPKQHSCINLPPTDDGERVPICPICDIPVPISRGENPNVRMDQHISNGCISAPKTTSIKPYNSCSFGKCKNRVAVQLLCSGCGKNYCIRHRLGVDHLCELKENKKKSLVKHHNKSKDNRDTTSKFDLQTSAVSA